VGGYIDRPNLDIEAVRDFLKAEMSKTEPGSSLCVGYMHALEKLNDLHKFKKDFHPALVRNDELIREARRELVIETARHHVTKVCLERAELLVARLHMEIRGDNPGGAGRDREAGEAVCDLPHGQRQQGVCRCSSHSGSAGCDPADEAGEGSRVPEGGVE
jgi:hypothetical protein